MSWGAEPKQKIEKILDDGSTVTLEFEYKENQLGWFFGVKWGDYDYKNIRLTTSYNILRAYRNYLPFGLRCDTQDDEEPMDLNDFFKRLCNGIFINSQGCPNHRRELLC